MHGADINVSICSANESVNNVDGDKEHRTSNQASGCGEGAEFMLKDGAG